MATQASVVNAVSKCSATVLMWCHLPAIEFAHGTTITRKVAAQVAVNSPYRGFADWYRYLAGVVSGYCHYIINFP